MEVEVSLEQQKEGVKKILAQLRRGLRKKLREDASADLAKDQTRVAKMKKLRHSKGDYGKNIKMCIGCSERVKRKIRRMRVRVTQITLNCSSMDRS